MLWDLGFSGFAFCSSPRILPCTLLVIVPGLIFCTLASWPWELKIARSNQAAVLPLPPGTGVVCLIPLQHFLLRNYQVFLS